MKSIITAGILFAGGLWAADEAADKVAIESTIRAFSLMPSRPGLVTSDFNRDELASFGKPAGTATEDPAIPVTIDGVDGTVVISKKPMGEAIWLPARMPGIIIVTKIRFVTAEVAIVDAVEKSPLLIVMKKEGMDWKIASLRRLAAN